MQQQSPKNSDEVGGSWRALYPFDSHFADVKGAKLHYLDEGNGTAVVMVHGNPTWSFYYRRLTLALRNDWRAIVPDHIGCGLSEKPQDYPYTLARHIDNLECLLDRRLQLRRLVLVVHDWGGAIGMGYAVRHPEKIAAIVILNTASFLLPRCPWQIRLCRLPLFGPLFIRGLNGFARGALKMATTTPGGLRGPVRDGYLFPYDGYASRIATLRFVQDIPLRQGHPTWGTLASVEERLPSLATRPVLICWGDRDFCFTPVFLERWHEIFPQANVHRFPDAGHYVLEDAGQQIAPLVVDFLSARAAEGGHGGSVGEEEGPG